MNIKTVTNNYKLHVLSFIIITLFFMNYFNAFQNYNFIYQTNLFRDTVWATTLLWKSSKKFIIISKCKFKCYKCSHPTQYLTTDTQL